MGVFSGPDINENGLVLALDAANPRNFNLTAVEVLVVAGGGGGGTHHGGGGGGGGVVYNSNFSVTPGSALTVTVGGGGSGGTYSPNANGSNGGNSVFGSITATGGGGGGTYANNGANGGSGGGANNWSTNATGGSGTSGQGFAGGSNNGQTNYGGGGGGAGGTAKGLSNNSGGDGLTFNISGSQVYYGGGGGAGVYPGYQNDTSYGYGGLGGGGNGGNGPHGSGTAPTAGGTNTGGGGGGVADLYQNGAVGGSGIVIVRYEGPQKAIGGTITSINGYTIHTFTAVGSTTFTPLIATNNSAILGLSDLSGKNNFATSVNGPSYNSSNGGSIVFDGTDDRINLPFSSVFDISSSMTMEGFIYPTAYKVGGGGGGMIITKVASYYSELQSDGKIRAYFYGLSSPGYHTSNGTVPLNTWTHFAIIRDANASTIVFYLNGLLDRIISSITGNITVQQTYYLTLGSYVGSGYEYTGRISNAKIYNRALTAAEIQQNFNATRSRFGI